MAQLGPAMAFETLGKILLVGLCGLTHYKRLELLATFAVTTVIVDFLIFMRYGHIHKTAWIWNLYQIRFVPVSSQLVCL